MHLESPHNLKERIRLEDIIVVVLGVVIGVAGVFLEIFVGGAVLHQVRKLF